MTSVLDEELPSGAATKRRRRWPWIAGVVVAALAAFVLFWFQPHKLFIDDKVVEAIPTVAAPTTTAAPADATTGAATAPPTAPPTTVPPEPVELARGEFISRDHGTSGIARVLLLADGSRIVRLEGLDTSNGPDLYLYVTTTPADGPEGSFDDEYVSLGRLKGNQGDQNYDLPADTDISAFATVLIWCDRFDSAFGAADLVPA